MDPNLFHLDWEQIGEVLAGVVIMAFIIERALAVLFESRFFISRWKKKSLKELIAFLIAGLTCWYWQFDAISMIFLKEKVTLLGMIITGAVVAGGSKGAIKLFRDVMGFKSTAQEEKEDADKAEKLQLASARAV
jgi:CHASE2 domain-containing sensor protein